MQLKSSGNSYYRYKVHSPEDTKPDTYRRRLTKARQNYKSNFIFEIQTSGFAAPGEPISFCIHNYKKGDLFLISPLYVDKLDPDFYKQTHLLITDLTELECFRNFKFKEKLNSSVLAPSTKPLLSAFIDYVKKNESNTSDADTFYWRFQPYNPNIPMSLTVRDIANSNIEFKPFLNIEIENTKAPSHYELEPVENVSYSVKWKSTLTNSHPLISVIIPTYNNSFFLHNVLLHLCQQDLEPEKYEVVVADDGSTDSSAELIHELFKPFINKINLTYIHWSKFNQARGPQNFFRSGLARNLGVRHSTGRYLQFLDSDILVPPTFLSTTLQALESNGLIQYQRFHINQALSRTNPLYSSVALKKDTYIEEENYWSQLFFCNNWSDLPHYWKYTCTYALCIKREDFLKIGMFKKYYISYGFEDTDLGFEAHKIGLKFFFIKLPLLHLTSYDQMQYKNSARKRLQLLRVTAELFYLQHLKKDIYELLIDFYRFQKPLKSFFRDLVS